MKIFVTGGSGFIGDCLLNSLSSAYTLIGQGRSMRRDNFNLKQFFEFDINSQSVWNPCLQDVNVVIHLAAVAHNSSTDPNYINEVNVHGTVHLARQAVEHGVKRFVFISSISVLGNSTYKGKALNEDSEYLPHSKCAQSKLDAEIALLNIAKETGLEVVILRPVLVYGADCPGNFGKLVNLVKKMPMLPFALCDNKRSFISLDNLVDFIAVCIEHPKARNEIFCISDGVDVSIKELTNSIAKGLGKNLIQCPVPEFVFSLLGKISGKQDQIEQLTGDLQIDSSKARSLLGWKPPFTMTDTLSRLSE
ncbi:NAD-dependent epimerase/dehydratase family protein [Vibrio splendidus]|uniref:NAD-dependent epimerase/dehydratase family protein n=1 Tax=Vibrio splendidus TaxID=29497 RepID=UPI000C85E6A4|nr:NAD-dependent epimerase/dehydratase family protein [Vibrio splendidus]MCC5519757.1 NAD-dependent epimerase/dehydratase family protein [Vibrio splendidus]